MVIKKNPGTGLRRIREFRQKIGLSLQELAEKTGLSLPYLSNVETEKANIGIINLRIIADALGVPVAHFFLDEVEQSILVTKKHQRKKSLFKHGKGKVLWEELLINPNTKIEPSLVRIPANTNIGPKPFSHDGFEFLWLLKGELFCSIGTTEFTISAGDTLLFPAILPHDFKNHQTKTATLLMIAIPD